MALLRGINVGGNNLIGMPDLRDCFTEMGFTDVATYIQSGNVLFRGAEVEEPAIEATLSKRFDYYGRVVVLSERRYKNSLAKAPRNWGHDEEMKHNALFTLANTTPAKVMAQLPPITEFEEVTLSPSAIFWSGSIEKLTRTMFLQKLAKHPLYKELTVRNHNTTFKLRDLLTEL